MVLVFDGLARILSSSHIPGGQIFKELDENIPQVIISTLHNNQLQLMPPWLEMVQLKVLQSKLMSWDLIGGDALKLVALLLNRNRCLTFSKMQQAQSEVGLGLEEYEYVGNCSTPAEDTASI